MSEQQIVDLMKTFMGSINGDEMIADLDINGQVLNENLIVFKNILSYLKEIVNFPMDPVTNTPDYSLFFDFLTAMENTVERIKEKVYNDDTNRMAMQNIRQVLNMMQLYYRGFGVMDNELYTMGQNPRWFNTFEMFSLWGNSNGLLVFHDEYSLESDTTFDYGLNFNLNENFQTPQGETVKAIQNNGKRLLNSNGNTTVGNNTMINGTITNGTMNNDMGLINKYYASTMNAINEFSAFVKDKIATSGRKDEFVLHIGDNLYAFNPSSKSIILMDYTSNIAYSLNTFFVHKGIVILSVSSLYLFFIFCGIESIC
jgi:hypothetical protein